MAVAGVDPVGDGDRSGAGDAQGARARRAEARPDIDLIELNEAFAAQALAVIKLLNIDPEKVNVRGGAIAIGHPLGASGPASSTTLLHRMLAHEAKLGLATMCVGAGARRGDDL